MRRSITSFPATISPSIVEVREVTKRYGFITAVNAVSFEIKAGQAVALLGSNGAGKTTTISMLLGLLLPSAGTIRVLGEDIVRHRHRVLARMNFSSPYVDLPHRLTVRENLTVYAHLYGVPKMQSRIDELAESLAIEALLNRPCGRLSAGQKTRVALAKALLNQPELLLLDEPTASLDPDTGDWIRGYLKSYSRNATLLLASHNMMEVERLCDFVLIMRQGDICGRGTPIDLVQRYGRETLEEVFLDIVRNPSD